MRGNGCKWSNMGQTAHGARRALMWHDGRHRKEHDRAPCQICPIITPFAPISLIIRFYNFQSGSHHFSHVFLLPIQESKMDHPFLQFDPNDERDAPCIPVLHSLWGRRRQIEQMKCLSWDLVVNLNQQTRLQPLITEPWSRLLYINRPQYRELLMEFFASYAFSFPSHNIYQKHSGLTFRLGEDG
ncbi:hypothetical protein R6Q59_028099 [Mikania micrantha]